MAFKRVAILGTGLIGASVGLAIKAAQPSVPVVGFDQVGNNARGAKKAKAIDEALPPHEAVRGADFVLVATPVGAMRTLFEDIAPHLAQGAVVMDTGSTKAQVLQWAEAALPEHVSFIGGHPMAGKTETGPGAADAALFNGAVWCLAPGARATQQAMDQVISLVQGMGAVPLFVDADEHDGLVAAISHLPYLMSVALIGHLGAEKSWRETASLAAGGFAYSTHLTESDPTMFVDIARSNRQNIARRIDRYIAELEALRDLVEQEDAAGLRQRFERARALHQDWLSGRAQGLTSSGESAVPSGRSMMTGGLLGRWGADRNGGKSRKE